MRLDGIKIVDFTWNIVGPLTIKTLSDYGAQVVRIEGRKRPDLSRLQMPFKDNIQGENRSGLFNQWNTTKLDLAVNLSHPKGKEIAKRFVGWADVVVESFAGGAMDKMGLGYQELRKVKPDIIMLSTCMQGQTGPHAQHPGTGFQLTALSGFTHISGWPDRPPVWLGPYTDYIGPHFCTLIILAAILHRRKTGNGQYIDMAQYENAVHLMAPLLLDYDVNKRVADRMGNRSASAVPHGAYRCRGEDRYCAIAVSNDGEWRNFCRVLGNPVWTKDYRFSTFLSRKENEDELDKLIETWTIKNSTEDVMNLMQTAGVAAGLIETAEDLMEHDPQLKHRHFFWNLPHPEVGSYRAPAPFFKLSKTTANITSAPLLGEHNEYALKEILHMSDDEVAELVIEGVLE